jgi:chloroplastic oxoene reductase
VAPANQAAKLPQGVSPTEASGLPVAATTALKALQFVTTNFSGTGKTFNVLITAASGGVGLYALQLAKLANFHVTATCGARNIDFVKSFGADEVLDYKTPEGASLRSPSGKKYDVVIHGSEGVAWSVFEPNLSENGKVIDLSPISYDTVVSSLEETTTPKKQLVPFMMKLSNEDLEFLVGLIKKGKLKTVIDSKYPFDMAPIAWARSIDGHATGKIIIRM